MGQNQPNNEGKEPKEGKWHIREPLKNRYGAKYGNEHDVNPAYSKGGKGGKGGNPGRPV